jgi:hypothetical protein
MLGAEKFDPSPYLSRGGPSRAIKRGLKIYRTQKRVVKVLLICCGRRDCDALLVEQTLATTYGDPLLPSGGTIAGMPPLSVAGAAWHDDKVSLRRTLRH